MYHQESDLTLFSITHNKQYNLWHEILHLFLLIEVL